ncbi:hypothetical protein MXF31_10900 [Mammaliicoccus sciuri]|uniref:hypothetical protein n=1 Tax=Mammaliicoccus sciuri TaxID=1296 RepID=UPI002DBDEA07|nr:hypothetical protein [Mammaliicoccus sciuri]MEB5650149.1 hypothetical protein [Mammaliicoccus sciuri]
MYLQNYTYECVKDNYHFKAGETTLVYPTFIPVDKKVYQFVNDKGELMTLDYLHEHYKKVEV